MQKFTFITFLTELLPLVMTLFFIKKVKLNYLKVFFIWSILLACFASTSVYFLYFKNSKPDYLFVLRVFIFIEYTIFIFFFSLISKNRLLKRIIQLSVFPFLVYCIYNFFISKPNTFNNYPALIEFAVFIFIIIFYFYEKMKVVTRIPLVNTISFWLIVGLFIYFTGNLFFLLFIPSVIETHDKEFIKNILMIYSGVTITKNLILSAAWFAKEQVQTDDDIIKIPEYIDLDDNFTFIKNTNP